MQLIPNEYQPPQFTAAEQRIRDLFTGLGFRVASRPFPGHDERLWYHCSRSVDGVDGDFAVSLESGSLYRWGTGESWTRETAVSEFGAPADSPAAADPAESADTGNVSENIAVDSENIAVDSVSAVIESPLEAQYTAAGFQQLRLSAAVPGMMCKYFAVRADSSRWLLDPNVRQCICMSDSPISVWRIGPSGQLFGVLSGAVRSTSGRTETPRQPVARSAVAERPVRHVPAAEAAPPVHAARRKQVSLFD